MSNKTSSEQTAKPQANLPVEQKATSTSQKASDRDPAKGFETRSLLGSGGPPSPGRDRGGE
jgi:hypothetical protein